MGDRHRMGPGAFPAAWAVLLARLEPIVAARSLVSRRAGALLSTCRCVRSRSAFLSIRSVRGHCVAASCLCNCGAGLWCLFRAPSVRGRVAALATTGRSHACMVAFPVGSIFAGCLTFPCPALGRSCECEDTLGKLRLGWRLWRFGWQISVYCVCLVGFSRHAGRRAAGQSGRWADVLAHFCFALFDSSGLTAAPALMQLSPRTLVTGAQYVAALTNWRSPRSSALVTLRSSRSSP